MFSESVSVPILLDGGPAVLVMGADITARKEMDSSLRASLAEKEVLLREVHHRVKHNLAAIPSLLALQRKALGDAPAGVVLTELACRIQSSSSLASRLRDMLPQVKPSRSRREFLKDSALGSGLSMSAPVHGAPAAPARYDLLIRGGRVIDPSQNLSAERDIAISGHRIAELAPHIDEARARQVLDARGLVVTPGLIDIHVHVYDGVAPLGIPADPTCIAKGVTTAVDAGSAGAHTFPGLRKYIINVADTRIYVLLNISVVGQSTLSTDNPWGELIDLRYANPKLAIRTIEQNRDVIVGVKIRLTRNITGDRDLEALGLARQAADAVKLPLMVHIGGSFSPLRDIMAMLKKGDIVTHSFRAGDGGILDSRDRVLPEVRAAIARGVNMDIGHGAGSFSFDTAEKALRQEVLPGTISSDVHQFNVNGPVFNLATTLTKFLPLGLSLEQVIERATVNPAAVFGFSNGLGSLRPGGEADVAVFALAEGNFEFTDSLGAKRKGQRKLVPAATVKGGKIYGSASLPVVEL